MKCLRLVIYLVFIAFLMISCGDDSANQDIMNGDTDIIDGDHDFEIDSEIEVEADVEYSGDVVPEHNFQYTEEREPCADYNPYRNLYFGDWHAHSSLSWDAYGYAQRTSLDEAYAFARGKDVWLPPLDANGIGTRKATIDRPLDFVGLTDHIEFWGEHLLCTLADSPIFDDEVCIEYRKGGQNQVTQFGLRLTPSEPERMSEICGDDFSLCNEYAQMAWQMIKESAELAYDRKSSCEFVSFPGYEYTGSTGIVNWHRNVIFRNSHYQQLPPSYFEQPVAKGLWDELEQNCQDQDNGCDVMVIPHNSNWSNGNLFSPYYSETEMLEVQKREARQRLRLEPVVEVMQHKGDMECKNGFDGIPYDPFCDFEKIRESDFIDCGDKPGWGGVNGFGCLSKLDYIRNVLAFGMQERQRLGVNPYKIGIFGSTDTHNGTPGMVSEIGFLGHVGLVDDTPEKRLGKGTLTHNPKTYNPGGLAAVWSQEKSRDAIFEAFRNREIYSTSGSRIKVRFFGGWNYSSDICTDPEALVKHGYAGGVPMGGDLPDADADDLVPQFIVYAEADSGTANQPGVPLQVAQIIKVWIDKDGMPMQKVYDVAGSSTSGAYVDEQSCERYGEGEQTLCATWYDYEFDPNLDALYYARVVENPSCRWVAYDCAEAFKGSKPDGCYNSDIPKSHQERAWTSPIWYEPK